MTTLDHYVDIQIKPDEDFSSGQLMGVLFGKLHRALAELQSTNIAICFPDHRQASDREPFMGHTLRILASQHHLQQLMELKWLVGVRDHITLSNMTQIPQTHQYRVVRRVQTQSSPERLQRRYIKRHDVSLEAVQKLITVDHIKFSQLPFVSIRSQSTGQRFRLFIEHGNLTHTPVQGAFNTYGLSAVATVPWF